MPIAHNRRLSTAAPGGASALVLALVLALLLAACASPVPAPQPVATAPSACFSAACCDDPRSLQFAPYRLYCRARDEDVQRRPVDASATFREAIAAARDHARRDGLHAEQKPADAWQRIDADAVLCVALAANARRAELSAQDSLLKLEEGLLACRAAYGPDADATAQAMMDVANQRLGMGETAGLQPQLERIAALALRHGNRGLEAEATDALGRHAGLAGDSETERRLLLQAVALKKAVYGEASVPLAQTYHRLGRSFTRADDGVPAREWYLRAIGILIDKLGAANPMTMEVMEEFANSHADDGNFKQAQIMFDMLLPKAIQTYGARDERTMVIVNSLASTLDRQKRHAKALALFDRSLKVRRMTMPDSVGHGATALNAAKTKRMLSSCAGAAPYAREALRVAKAVQAAHAGEPQATAFLADAAAYASACKMRPAATPKR